ncbi:hypothetical protein BH11BAC3_BH11BAC3_38550 [soil metagenome]
MKTLLVMLTLMVLSFGVSAQRKGGHYVAHNSRIIIRPSIGFGLGYGYPYSGYPYLGYGNPYGYGYGDQNFNRRMPYDLSLQIQSIEIDYKNQIKTTRHNKSISGPERRQEIRNLKTERDQAIIAAKRNFRKGNFKKPNQHTNGSVQENNNSSNENTP